MIGPRARALRSQVEQRISDLPLLPDAILDLVCAEPGTTDLQHRVQTLVEREPALASRIAALAHRVDPEAAEPVRSLPQAIARIGAQRAGRMITSLFLLRTFAPDTEERRDLWRHALQTATAAREIARASGHDVPPGKAYVAGLLHDIGRFILLEEAPDNLRENEQPGWDASAKWLVDERRQCGYDHAEVGHKVCQAWSLPDELALVARLHHEPEPEAELLHVSQQALLRIVQQADRLSCLLLAQPEIEDAPADERLTILDEACVHPSWDWVPAGPTHLDLLLGPIRTHGDQLIGVLGLEST
jgi:putative nucleotidyltransferase with HDIG domain